MSVQSLVKLSLHLHHYYLKKKKNELPKTFKEGIFTNNFIWAFELSRILNSEDNFGGRFSNFHPSISSSNAVSTSE